MTIDFCAEVGESGHQELVGQLVGRDGFLDRPPEKSDAQCAQWADMTDDCGWVDRPPERPDVQCRWPGRRNDCIQ